MDTETGRGIPEEETKTEFVPPKRTDFNFDLRNRIRAIKGLPHEMARCRYSSLFSDEEKFVGHESIDPTLEDELVCLLQEYFQRSPELPQREIDGYLAGFFQNRVGAAKTAPLLIDQIAVWIDSKQGREHHKRVELVHNTLAKHMEETKMIILQLLALLGEVDQRRIAIDNERSLAQAMENIDLRDIDKIVDQLAVLNRLNDPLGNLLLHKILDFLQTHMRTTQNRAIDEGRNWMPDKFTSEMVDFAARESAYSRNYLLQKHFEDFVDISENFYGYNNKQEVIHGIPGGASDETIYTFRNLRRSYINRRKLKINEGWPISNPVLQISPGYYGYYCGGRLDKVYAKLDQPEKSRGDTVMIKENDSADEQYIYDFLGRPRSEEQRTTNFLEDLQGVFDFQKGVKAAGRKFFYDLERIDQSNLHPVVYGEIVTHNQRYLDGREGKKNAVESILSAEYEELISSAGRVPEAMEYEYRYLMSLQMRKKIEESFGFDIAEIPVVSQVHFLNYVSHGEVADFERARQVFLRAGDNRNDIAVAFFASAVDANFGETILKLAETLDRDAGREVFVRYRAFVMEVDRQKKEIQEIYEAIFSVPIREPLQIMHSLLARANHLLTDAYNAMMHDANDSATILEGLMRSFDREATALKLNFQAFKQATEQTKIQLEKLVSESIGIDKEEFVFMFMPTKWLDEYKVRNPELAAMLEKSSQHYPEERRPTSEGVQNIISELEKEMTISPEHLDIMRKIGGGAERYEQEILPRKRRENPPKITRLREFLKYQRNLEAKFQAMITRADGDEIGEELLADLPEEVKSLEPEKFPEKKNYILPSRDFKRDAKVAGSFYGRFECR